MSKIIQFASAYKGLDNIHEGRPAQKVQANKILVLILVLILMWILKESSVWKNRNGNALMVNLDGAPAELNRLLNVRNHL